jgi:hypothetical protein
MLWGFLASLSLILTLGLHNWRRSRLQEVQELKPNCLLTSAPLVFIPGKRSLFYFLAYWNKIPHWLASHGYEVYHFNLPWVNEGRRRRDLNLFLQHQSKSKTKIHLFIDESSLREVTSLLKDQDYDCLASVTLIGANGKVPPFRLAIPIAELELPVTEPLRSPLFWRLHSTWTFQSSKRSLHQLGWQLSRQQGDVLLDRVQFLAERDLLQRAPSPNLEA